MKYLLTLLLTCILLSAGATNYFVSNAGSNSANGTTTGTAWQTLTKVNAFSYAAGDTVKFNRGDIFTGTLRPKPGVIYDYYGSGALPVISGLTTATGWVSDGGGIYYVDAPAAKSNLNLVLINNSPVGMGRYPNADAAGGGYLKYESASIATSITDNQLTSSPDWTGAMVYSRLNQWRADRFRITGHTGTTLNYVIGSNINANYPAVKYVGTNNYGYFFMNKKSTLDQLFEWFLDSTTHRLYMYFGANNPNSYAVKYSTVDTGCNMAANINININHLAFEGFTRGVYSYYGSNITITNCSFTNMGSIGIQVFNSANVLIEGCTVTDILSTGVSTYCKGKSNITIRNCTITRCGQIDGMGSNFSEGDNCGIFCSVLSNGLVQNNNITYCGAAGIYFGGNYVIVENNVVKYCNSRLEDRGNIYSFDDFNEAGVSIGSVIRNNVCAYAIGAPNGTNSSTIYVALIYLDGKKSNTQVLNNTLFESGKNGIHCNNPANVLIRGNTVWNCRRPFSTYRRTYSDIYNLVITNNTLLQFDNSLTSLAYGNADLESLSLAETLKGMGNVDSNYWYHGPAAGYQFEVSPAVSNMNFDTWKAYTGFDSHSSSITLLPTYTLKKIVTATLTTNGTFTSNITGWYRAGNGSAAWDAGRLKFTFSAPKPNTNSLIYGSVGTVAYGKRYIARVTLTGSNTNGVASVWLRKSASPNTRITDSLLISYNTTPGVKEFLLSPTTTAPAHIVVSMEQNSGTTWIDNVMLYEADATVLNPLNALRFEVNETGAAKDVTLTDGTYVDFVTGASVTSFTLAAGGSQILKRTSSNTNSTAGQTVPGTSSGGAAVIFLNK